MPYNRNLYSSSESAIDAGMIYDQTEEKLQSEINAEVSSDITELDDSLATFVRPNLLDNWYFVGGGSQFGDGIFPINQKGLTIYTGAINSIDRWRSTTSSTTIGLLNDYVRFASSAQGGCFFQEIKEYNQLAGKVVTLSILVGNHVIGRTVELPETLPALTDTTVTLGTTLPVTNYESPSFNGYSMYMRHINGVGVVFYITAGSTYTDSIRMTAVKLEIGTTQTLAHLENDTWVLNELPKWEEEYSKCVGHVDRKNPRPNLLDNWYFVGGGSQRTDSSECFPINQTAQTSYSTTGYCIDRWWRIFGTTNLTANGLVNTVDSSSQYGGVLRQPVSSPLSLAGKKVTISMLVKSISGGQCGISLAKQAGINSGMATVISPAYISSPGLVTATGTIPSDVGGSTYPMLVFGISIPQGVTVTIEAVKLEIGDSQTLAHQENGTWVLNELPNWYDTLQRCLNEAPYASYIKYPDGTLIQWGRVTGISFNNQVGVEGTFNLPVNFIDPGSAVCVGSPAATSVNAYAFRLGINVVSSGTIGWILSSGSGAAITVTNRQFSWMAIGHWRQ